MAVIADRLGIDLVNVPYSGSMQAFTDLLSGEISLMLVDPASGQPLARSGDIRILSLTSSDSNALIPGVPGTREAGLPDVNMVTWNGMFGPARMPEQIVSRLNKGLQAVLADPSVKAQLAQLGFQAEPGSASDFDEFVRGQLTNWKDWVNEAGIQPQ